MPQLYYLLKLVLTVWKLLSMCLWIEFTRCETKREFCIQVSSLNKNTFRLMLFMFTYVLSVIFKDILLSLLTELR